MANVDRPRGLEPIGKVKQAVAWLAGSTVYPGDAVALADDGAVDAVSAGAVVLGVALNYATAGQEVLVSVDPTQLYRVQADGNEVASQAVVGSCADIVATAGDSVFKVSRHELDSSTINDATPASAQLIIVGIDKRVDNDFGAQVDCIVKINEAQLKDGYAGL